MSQISLYWTRDWGRGREAQGKGAGGRGRLITQSPVTNHQSPITNHQSPVTNKSIPFTSEVKAEN
ncbi:MAG: hypothetical protein ACKO9I_19370 [Sphaerospermopsis kisseleviana]|uniref:hypothetical protein n=1 Tax=Sphaerospermopsis TaxID=752201 RepID=UPI0010F62EE5|nr:MULTISPECIES: hypothetical protein [Sphaerospermopsis]MBD2133513.1 hypothetical protein [Sphaerospermopsis sp. FACHB-1094]MBD2146629.1 hypothetical protein [Sphaerospermopsis sp. FACHB-1194]